MSYSVMRRMVYTSLVFLALMLLQPVLAAAQMGPMGPLVQGSSETMINITVGDDIAVDGVTRILVLLPNATGHISGDGSLLLNESIASLVFSGDANVSFRLDRPVESDMRLDATVAASLSGSGGSAPGEAHVVVSIVSPSMPGGIELDLPMQVMVGWSNTTVSATISSGNGSLRVGSSTAAIELRARLLLDYEQDTASTILDARIEADDPDTAMTAYMAVMMLLVLSGFPVAPAMKPPMYDPATGKYYMEISAERTTELGVQGAPGVEVLGHAVSIDSARLDLALNTTLLASGTTLRILATMDLVVDATGNFSQSSLLRGDGLQARSMTANYSLKLLGGGVLEFTSSFSSILSYDGGVADALRALKTVVENAVSSMGADTIVVHGAEPYRLAMDGEPVAKLVFTPSNATRVSGLGLIAGDVLVQADGDKLVYTMLAPGRAAIQLPPSGWSIAEVHAQGQAVLELPSVVGGRVVSIVFPAGGVEVEFTQGTRLSATTVTVAVLAEPPPGLPEQYRPLSPYYDVSLGLAAGKALVKLYYEGEPAGELRVAHYRDGVWELLEPVETGSGYVVVEATSLSPLVVVELKPETTTTTTETSTATTTTTTTREETTATTSPTATTTTHEEEHEEAEEEHEEYTETSTRTTTIAAETEEDEETTTASQPATTMAEEAEEEEETQATSSIIAGGGEREEAEEAEGTGGPSLFLIAVVATTLAALAVLSLVARKRTT